MPSIICCANQKGGVGKTTTVINLGVALALRNKRILLIDCDPQANMTSGLGVYDPEKTIYDLVQGVSLRETIQSTEDGVDIIPSSIDFAGAALEFQQLESQTTQLAQAFQASDFSAYDFVFLDAPPSLDLITINCLVAASQVLIPLQCEYFALEGLSKLMNSIEAIKISHNSGLSLYGILFTMFSKRTRIAGEVVKEVAGAFRDDAFNTIIPRNVTLAEAPSYGKSIFSYDASSLGAKSYARLADEVLER